MSFLTLNGIDIPARDGSPSQQLLEIGSRSRAKSGTMRISRIATKREYSFEMPPTAASDALAYGGLIQGDGHVWNFDSANNYSSKGLGPSATTGTVNWLAGKFSTTGLALSGASVASSITFTVGTLGAWTVGWWESTNAGVNWSQRTVLSNGDGYVDGVFSAGLVIASVARFNAGSVSFTISATSATATRIDDLFFYPFVAPQSFATAFAAGVSAWPSSPLLTAAGDAIPASVSVHGQVTGVKVIQGLASGSLRDDLYVTSFTLAEV